MADYSSDHAGALAAIQEAGVAVTFTLASSTYDATTDTASGATSSSVSGYAIQTKSVRRFADGELVAAPGVTLLFAPSTYGDEPDIGSTVDWAGDTWEVTDVESVAPSADAIISRVSIA